MNTPGFSHTLHAAKQAVFRPTLHMLLSCVCALNLLTGCDRPTGSVSPQTLPTAAVRVQRVELSQQAMVEDVVGTVRARVKSSVSAKITGRIERLPVEVSQTVKAGDLLAELDVREIKAQLDQAIAVRDQAESDLKRLTKLLQQEAIAKSEFDAVLARQRVAEANVREAETMLGYAKVQAPFNGVVTRKLAEVGDLATPGRALLEIEDPTTLRFEADVPEALIDRLSRGGTNAVQIGNLTNHLHGVVSEIAPAADPNSRTFLAKFDLPEGAAVRAGQFGRVRVVVGETKALLVPQQAVVKRGQMELVFVAANQRAQLRLVKTGKRAGEEVEILSGVDAGETIVTSGSANLVDGQPLQAKP